MGERWDRTISGYARDDPRGVGIGSVIVVYSAWFFQVEVECDKSVFCECEIERINRDVDRQCETDED